MIVELQNWIGDDDIKLFMLRGDLIHPEISGNKWWKLKYNIAHCKNNGFRGMLTFGGAFSNHLAAVAAAGRIHSLKTIGIVRGEQTDELNETLGKAETDGMELVFVSREDYRLRNSTAFQQQMEQSYPRYYIVPEGGSNALAIKGVKEMIEGLDELFDVVCVPVGTGGTMAGIVAAENVNEVVGFAALKQEHYLEEEVTRLLDQSGMDSSSVDWRIEGDYHFGGYAKLTPELVEMCMEFSGLYGFELDYIYTSKMMYGVRELVKSRKIPPASKVLVIHTGGIQGNDGMRKRYDQLFSS